MSMRVKLRDLVNGDRVNLRGYGKVLILGPLVEYEAGSDKWNFAIVGDWFVAKVIGFGGEEEVEKK